MSGIDTEWGEVFVQRNQNGWVVSRGRYGWSRNAPEGMYDDRSFVARTPKELCDLLADWATRQQDTPPVPKG